jgi:hypothetical protein
MPYSKAEQEQIIRAVCPHCAAGIKVRQRSDTREWVHDSAVGKTGFAHTICLATHFRNSQNG